MKRGIMLLFIFSLFSISFLHAGIFSKARVGWNSGMLEFLNIPVGNKLYWAKFKYDAEHDRFILAKYGEIKSSNSSVYCRNSGYLGPMCELGKIVLSQKSQNYISGTITIGSDTTTTFTGKCDGELCSITTPEGCKGNFLIENTSINAQFYPGLSLSMLCQQLMIFSGEFVKSGENTSFYFDSAADENFLSKYGLLVPIPQVDENDILCFNNRKICYKFNPGSLSFDLITKESEENYNVNDIMDIYSKNGVPCKFPFVKFPANPANRVKYPIYPIDSLLYVVQMTACIGSDDHAAYVKAYLVKQDNSTVDLGYFNHNLQLTPTHVKFYPENYMKFYLFDYNNPLPGNVIKILKEHGYKGFIIASFCAFEETDENPIDYKYFEIK